MSGKYKKKAAKKSRAKQHEADKVQRMLPVPDGVSVSDVEVGLPADVFGSGHLLETCRTHWQHGKWVALRTLTEAEVAQDRDRARLAALLAAEASHSGDMARARQFMRLARDWGCNFEILSRLMISAAKNTLGRATMALGETDAAADHFRTAISLVEPHADAQTLGRVRHIRETADLGLKLQAAQLFEAAVYDEAALHAPEAALESGLGLPAFEEAAGFEPPAHHAPSNLPYQEPPPALKEAPKFSSIAHRRLWESEAPFLYIDSKSLPRSGLHFFRNTLGQILGSDFSFCEWYVEPGCCQKSPCIVPVGGLQGPFKLRLVKSHDFDLADPAWALGSRMARVVLIRDPLFVLTSWWTLQTLYKNSDMLREHGIHNEKISYMHEAGMVDAAHRLVAEQGVLPNEAELAAFLRNKSDYIVDFTKKWTAPDLTASGMVTVHDYSKVSQLVLDLLAPWEAEMSDEARFRFRRFALSAEARFAPREDAFSGRTSEMTAHLHRYEAAFQEAATAIRKRVGPGVFSEA